MSYGLKCSVAEKWTAISRLHEKFIASDDEHHEDDAKSSNVKKIYLSIMTLIEREHPELFDFADNSIVDAAYFLPTTGKISEKEEVPATAHHSTSLEASHQVATEIVIQTIESPPKSGYHFATSVVIPVAIADAGSLPV